MLVIYNKNTIAHCVILFSRNSVRKLCTLFIVILYVFLCYVIGRSVKRNIQLELYRALFKPGCGVNITCIPFLVLCKQMRLYNSDKPYHVLYVVICGTGTRYMLRNWFALNTIYYGFK